MAPSPNERIARWGLRAAVALAAAQAGTQLVNFGAFDLRIGFLDSSRHASLFGIVSLLALAAAAGAAAVLLKSHALRQRDGLLVVILLGTVFALRVARPPHVLVLALPFMGLAFLVLWRVHCRSERGRRLIRAGCIVLAGSFVVHAFGTEVVSALGFGADTWPYQAKLVVKHSAELSGWILVATGLGALWPGRSGLPGRR